MEDTPIFIKKEEGKEFADNDAPSIPERRNSFMLLSKEEEGETPNPDEDQKLSINENNELCNCPTYLYPVYSCVCNSCSYPGEFLNISVKDNTVYFKCLNPEEKEREKKITINEYLESIKKYINSYKEINNF